MDIKPLLEQILTAPTPDALWELYGHLLAAGTAADAPVLQVVERFHTYLCDLQSKATARQFSELASVLDISAVGGVALENLVGEDAHKLWKRLLIGATSESLMVLASRQYIKGWQAELHSVHRQAAWFLADRLWRWSAAMQPEMPAEERWAAIDRLFAPVHDPGTPDAVRVILLGHAFQLVLLSYFLPALTHSQA